MRTKWWRVEKQWNKFESVRLKGEWLCMQIGKIVNRATWPSFDSRHLAAFWFEAFDSKYLAIWGIWQSMDRMISASASLASKRPAASSKLEVQNCKIFETALRLFIGFELLELYSTSATCECWETDQHSRASQRSTAISPVSPESKRRE